MARMDTGSDGGTGSKRAGLISANDLAYVLEPDLSVAVNKTRKDHFFGNDKYTTGSRSICIINSGADYIDTRRSFLSFTISSNAHAVNTSTPGGVDGPGAVKTALPANNTTPLHGFFGHNGSACNLIESVTVSTRSGDELSRIDEFGMFNDMMLPLMHDKQWMDTVGQAMGFGQGVLSGHVGAVGATSEIHQGPGGTAGRKFVIPLYILSPLFQYGRLLPSMLMSGLRIEIKWASSVKACQFCPGVSAAAFYTSVKVPPATTLNELSDPQTYVHIQPTSMEFEIKKPKMSLCSIQLSDAIQRALNEQSAVNGLEIVFSDYDHQEQPGSQPLDSTNTETFNIEIRKSCSRALKAFARCAYGPSTANHAYLMDSFRGEQSFPYLKYQWRLGSLYFPQQPVQDENPAYVVAESYADTLDAVNRYSGRPPRLPLYGDTSGPAEVSNSDGSAGTGGMTNQYNHFVANQFTDVTGGGGLAHNGSNFLETVGNPEAKVHGHRTVPLGRVGSFANDGHVISVDLERSTMFNLAGIPINNSRVLALNATVQSANLPGVVGNNGHTALQYQVTKRMMHVYLKYVKLARDWLNNVEVEQ